MGTPVRFNSAIEASFMDAMHRRANDRMKKYSNLSELFGESWVDKMFVTNFDLGIPPMLDFFIVADQESADRVLRTMDSVIGAFDRSDKAFLEKVQRLKEYLPFRQMRQYFIANTLELYVCGYLQMKGFDCELRLKSGADLIVQTPRGPVDVEITVRNKSLLQHELQDILRRCVPQPIRDNYRIEAVGQFRSDDDFYTGMASLLTQLEAMDGYPEVFTIAVGVIEQVRFSFKRTKVGYIADSASANFASHDYVFNEVGYKLRDKHDNPNQTGGSNPTVVIVEAGGIPHSPELVIMDHFRNDVEYPKGKIPSNIDVAVMYWLTLDRIQPWYVIGTCNSGDKSAQIDTGLLSALGVKSQR